MSGPNHSDSAGSAGGTPTSASPATAGSSPGGRRWWWIIAAVVAVVAIGGGAAFYAASDPKKGGANDAVGVVRRGTLVVSIQEDGEVEAEKRIVVANNLRWPVIIDEIVEDGVLVKEGEIIVKFSCKELEDAISKKELTVRTARSNYEQAEANLELKGQEVAERLRKAKQAIEDAIADRKRYLEGEWPMTKKEAEEDLVLKRRELALTQENLDFKVAAHTELEDKSPYTTNEIENDKLALARKGLALTKATADLKMLLEYDHPKQQRKLENTVREAKLALERALIDTKIEMRKAEELVLTRKETLERHEKELKRLKEDEAKLTVKAEKEGLVVYDTGRRRWDPTPAAIAKGEKVNPRQQIMIIPDMTTLQIRTKVYEAVYGLVHKGLKASVRLETNPQEALSAKVSKVNTLPDRSAWWNPGVKVFPVTVKLDAPVEGLKPNMTAKVELELKRLEDVVIAPVAGVFSEQDKTYCWLADGNGGRKKVVVEVGLSNDKEVEIVSGLEPGAKVLLVEPEVVGEAEEPEGEAPPGMPE